MALKTRMTTIVLALFVATACVGITAEPPAASALQVVTIGAMAVERAAHQATLLPDGQVLITGGCGGHGCDRVHTTAEIFDPTTRSFQAVLPMHTPRASHAAVALPDGRVLVAGGWTGQRATATAEIYDPASGVWIAVGDMIEARASPIAVLLADGRVLVLGGGEGGLADLATAEMFDPATATFSTVSPMHTNHYLATLLADGRVLVTGGQSATGEILRTAEIFDPVTGAFSPTGAMAVPRVKHAAALLDNGHVLIIGGSDTRGYSGRYTHTEIYNPATGTFLPGPDLRWGRHKIRDAVTVLPSGAVLVAGGAERLELFDPAQQRFVPVEGELTGPQMFATATLLANGEVLVLGGYDDQIRTTGTAWLVHSHD